MKAKESLWCGPFDPNYPQLSPLPTDFPTVASPVALTGVPTATLTQMRSVQLACLRLLDIPLWWRPVVSAERGLNPLSVSSKQSHEAPRLQCVLETPAPQAFSLGFSYCLQIVNFLIAEILSCCTGKKYRWFPFSWVINKYLWVLEVEVYKFLFKNSMKIRIVKLEENGPQLRYPAITCIFAYSLFMWIYTTLNSDLFN